MVISYNNIKLMKSLTIITGIMTGILTDTLQLFISEKSQFLAISFVVFLDAGLGIAKAVKLGNFETNKSFKFIKMTVVFWSILATVLVIEHAYPFASFLSEAVMFPILILTLISALKNAQLLGLLSNKMLEEILNRIDKHKEVSK